MLFELQLLLQGGDKHKADTLRRALNSMWANADADFLPRADLLRLDAQP